MLAAMRGARTLAFLAACAVTALTSFAARANEAPPDRQAAPRPPTAQRIYVKMIPDRATWMRYSRQLGSDRFGKFVIDVHTNAIYFFDVNVFKIHADFVLGILLKQEWNRENIIEYNKNYERVKPRFILGYLTEHLKVHKLTLSFWEGDKIDAATVKRAWDRLNQTFFEKNLPFRPDSPMQGKVAKEVARKFHLHIVTNDQIYKEAPYQAFNKGRAVGRLRVVPPGTPYDQLTFDRHDIVILQESYPDISPVSGIMFTVFSTPLSHVNLRATAWGIPNAGYVGAEKDYAALNGKIVYYEVDDTKHVLRPATQAEITELEKKMDAARRVELPAANLTNADLPMLDHMRAADVTKYGTKGSNLGEIASAHLDGVNVPKGFGVPFFYYVQHLKQHGLDARIDRMLADPLWKTDVAWRKKQLADLQQAIRKAPLDPEVEAALYKRVRIKLGGVGVFVRSLTNSEDLPGFNGAGLYDTVPNVRGRRQLGEAVKQVWASLWNFRAVEERALFGIDNHQVYPGVLIQVGVDASAAGVLITANLYNPEDDDSFTINAKRGLGIRVVEGTRVPEQIIFDTSNDGTKIISRSDDPVMLVFDPGGGVKEMPTPDGGVILTEARAKRLATAVMKFRPLFPADSPLDVEWLLAGEEVWIVQSRPYVGAH